MDNESESLNSLLRLQTVKGLDSQWITETILASGRPTTRLIKQYEIVEQLKRLGVTHVLNLQTAGEHHTAADPLDSVSGFAYNPTEFTSQGIKFHNFPVVDFSTPSSPKDIIDVMQIIKNATSSGKILVHCFAGRGRTGLIIACYLIMHHQFSTQDAIKYVRERRNGSIETHEQVDFVYRFAKEVCEESVPHLKKTVP